jgi:hypothetical protein
MQPPVPPKPDDYLNKPSAPPIETKPEAPPLPPKNFAKAAGDFEEPDIIPQGIISNIFY